MKSSELRIKIDELKAETIDSITKLLHENDAVEIGFNDKCVIPLDNNEFDPEVVRELRIGSVVTIISDFGTEYQLDMFDPSIIGWVLEQIEQKKYEIFN